MLCIVHAGGVDGRLVMYIAERIHYWILYEDVPLQTLAVKIISNLSLVKTNRTAIAEAGILNSVIGKYDFLLALSHRHTTISCV